MKIVAQPDPDSGLDDHTIKVDHAGEHGAICIYAGQRVVTQLTDLGALGG